MNKLISILAFTLFLSSPATAIEFTENSVTGGHDVKVSKDEPFGAEQTDQVFNGSSLWEIRWLENEEVQILLCLNPKEFSDHYKLESCATSEDYKNAIDRGAVNLQSEVIEEETPVIEEETPVIEEESDYDPYKWQCFDSTTYDIDETIGPETIQYIALAVRLNKGPIALVAPDGSDFVSEFGDKHLNVTIGDKLLVCNQARAFEEEVEE